MDLLALLRVLNLHFPSLSLSDSLLLAEQIEALVPSASSIVATDPRFHDSVVSEIRAGRKIMAIKAYRGLTHSTLMEAKTAVEAVAGVVAPEMYTQTGMCR